MSIYKRVQDLLNSTDIEDRYIAANFLLKSEKDIPHMASKHRLSEFKLKTMFNQKIKDS